MRGKNKILIFGNGQMGNFYLDYFKKKERDVLIASADITKLDEVKKIISQIKPQIVINTAAKTNLEWCAGNKLEAFNVNVLGTDNLASVCDEYGVYFVQLSSGCIFSSKDTSDFKKEDDTPNPLSYYSWTKVWAENIIGFKRSKKFRYLILRPRQPVSSQVNYKNMLMKLLTFSKFVDTPNSGTVIEDLMMWTEKLINKKAVGIYHVANSGYTTPYKISKILKKYILPKLEPELISKKQLDELTPETRVDTLLDVKKLEKEIGKVKPYEERLEEIIKQLGINLKTEDKNIVREQFDKTMKQTKSRTIPNKVWKNLI